MNRSFVRALGIATMSIACAVSATTSEVRSPLSLYWGYFGSMHYPLDPVAQEKDKWFINEVWNAFYARWANKTFLEKPDCNNTCVSANKVTTDTAPLSALFFGQSDFRGEQVFAGGLLIDTPAPPALIFATLSPRFEYNEWGLFAGVDAYHNFGEDGTWRFGLRAVIPFKVIDVEQGRACDEEIGIEESLDNVRSLKIENIGDQSFEQVFAYRLDFLSALQLPNGDPMVVYGDGTVANRMMIGNVVVAGNSDQSLNSAVNGNTPVHVLGRPDGTRPPVGARPPDEPPCSNFYPGAVPYAEVRTLQDCGPTGVVNNVLPATGPNSTVNERYFFQQSGQNYAAALALDRTAQSHTFVVPRQQGEEITDDATLIMNLVEDVIRNGIADVTAVEFFRNCCNFFCLADSVVGFGDLDLSAYVGYHNLDNTGFVDFILGLRFPTGKKNHNPGRLLAQPTGNNGHVEVRGMLQGGARPTDWFGIALDASYTYVLKANEKRAAAFAGATVINIGTTVNAEVHWSYVMAHLDLTFFHPRNRDLGWSVGYEFYDKMKDKIRYCQPTAIDCLGRVEPLDECLAASLSNTQTHKFRCEFFDRIGFAEFFAGASQIFAGKFAMKESEWHIGVAVFF